MTKSPTLEPIDKVDYSKPVEPIMTADIHILVTHTLKSLAATVEDKFGIFFNTIYTIFI